MVVLSVKPPLPTHTHTHTHAIYVSVAYLRRYSVGTPRRRASSASRVDTMQRSASNRSIEEPSAASSTTRPVHCVVECPMSRQYIRAVNEPSGDTLNTCIAHAYAGCPAWEEPPTNTHEGESIARRGLEPVAVAICMGKQKRKRKPY